MNLNLIGNMKHLKRIFESDNLDPMSYLIRQAIDNFDEVVMSNVDDLTQEDKIEYLKKSRNDIKRYLGKLDSQIELEINRVIQESDDPIERLKAWMNKPKHLSSGSVINCFNRIGPGGGRFLHNAVYQDRHMRHSVIDILNDYFTDEDGELVLGEVPEGNDYNTHYFLTPEAIDDIIATNVDKFTYDW